MKNRILFLCVLLIIFFIECQSPTESTIGKTQNISTPSLIYPQNGDQNQSVNITFSWEKPEENCLYHIQISNDSLFNQIVYDVDSININAYEVSNLAINSNHFWHLKASKNKSESLWSSTNSFFTSMPNVDNCFQKVFSNGTENRAVSVKVSSQNEIIVLGTGGQIRPHLWLLKLDENGNLINEKNIFLESDSTDYIIPEDLICTSDGHFVVLNSNFILKLNSNFETKFIKYYSGYFLKKIEETNDGNFFIVGAYDKLYQPPLLLLTDAEGNQLWTRELNHGKDVSDLIRSKNDDFIYTLNPRNIVGGPWPNPEIHIVGPSGTTISYNSFGSGSSILEKFNSITLTNSNGFLLSGYEFITSDYTKLWICNIDHSLEIEWEKKFNFDGINEPVNAIQCEYGGFIILCFGNPSYLLKTDIYGAQVWRKNLSNDYPWFRDISLIDNGSYVVIGENLNSLIVNKYNIVDN